MKKNLLFVCVVLLILLFSNSFNVKIFSPNKNFAEKLSTSDITVEQGSAFYKKQCGYCHTTEELIGPDMNKIKAFYLKKYPKKQDFVNAMVSFVSNPSKKNAIYLQDKDFMMMPKMPFKKDKIKAAASYIFDTKSFK